MTAGKKASPAYQVKEQLCWLARELSARHLLGDGMGSLSARAAGGEIWVTPTEEHPAFLTASQLLRVAGDGRLYGPGTLEEQELLHHRRIYRQVPQAGAVLVLCPVCQGWLRHERAFPELPGGPVDLEMPLCDRGRALRGILWQDRMICWGTHLADVFRLADKLDRDYYSRCFSPPRTEQRGEDKASWMNQVVEAITKSILDQRKGGDGLSWS